MDSLLPTAALFSPDDTKLLTYGFTRADPTGEALEGAHVWDLVADSIVTRFPADAPVTAVAGNVDGLAVRAVLPEQAVVDAAGVRVAVIHGHQVHPDYRRLLARFPDARVIVHGHTHVPRCDRVGDVLIVNPGAAGQAQKGHPPCVAILEVVGGEPAVRYVPLDQA